MITDVHPVAPEDLMALLDGELATDEARVVSAHLEHCAECGELASQFRAVSRSLSGWSVHEAPTSLEESVMEQAARGPNSVQPRRDIRLSLWNWRVWAIGGGGAVAAVLILMVVASSFSNYENRPRNLAYKIQAQPTPTPNADEFASADASRRQTVMEPKAEVLKGKDFLMNPTAATDPGALAKSSAMRGQAMQGASAGIAPKRQDVAGSGASSTPAAPNAPMIARTVDLNIVVRDFPAARASLDAIVARHNGYAAHLSMSNTDNTPRVLQDSLRIPSNELVSALAEIKSLGRVIGESQSGEEVTQQHADLVARLQNSRETEQRLRDILAQRTGKIEDVLQVEEEIARVRAEIEGMESDQKTLEHRVDFASVDLNLSEEYKEQFNTPSTSVSTQIGNGFVTGMRNAASMLLGLVLFIEEVGPVLLIWLAILGVPAFLVWRRYRRMKGKV